MNKLFTKIAAVVLGATMATGVGVAVAAGVKEAIPAFATTNTVKYTIAGTSSVNVTGTAPTGSSASLTSTGGESGKQLTYGKAMTLTLTGYDGVTITGLEISAKSNTSKGKASLDFKSGSNSICSISDSAFNTSAWYGSWSTAYVNIEWPSTNHTLTERTVGTSESVTFNITNHGTSKATNSIYCEWIEITYSISSSKTVESLTVLDESANELSDGDEVNATLAADTHSASAEITAEVGYSGGDKDGSVDISSSPSAGFSYSTDDDSTYTLTFTADGDYDVTIAAHEDDTVAMTVTYHVSGVAALIWEKVTSVSRLKAGKEIIIGNTDGSYVMAPYVSGNNCPNVTSTPDEDENLPQADIGSGFAILTLGGSSGAWTLTDQNDKVYFGVSGQNYLKASADATDTWSITIDSTSHEATITSAASSRWIAQNTSNNAFATYANNNQWEVAIYMLPSTDPAIEVAVTGSQSLGIGETAVLTATKLNGATGTVSWATSNSSILSLSAATGDSVTVTAGSTTSSATITASLSGCDDVETAFTVRRGSATEPYTVAQAMVAIDGSDSGAKTGVYTSGIVSQVDSLNADNSITYWISDNGTTTNQMEVYKGFDEGCETFKSIDDLQVGDEVVVFGDLTKYSTTYEYASGSELYSHNRPVTVLATITAIEGSLSAKAGTAAWDLSGLIVKGTYSGSETVVDVTAHVDLTTEDVPGTPSSTTVRNVSVTATGKDDSSITLTQNVQGTITVDTGLVTAGKYRIKATRDSVTYYLKENGTSSAPSAVTDYKEATIFDFTLVADNTYTISNGANYLYCTATNNGVRFGDTSTALSDRWTISNGSLESGKYDLYSANGSRYLALYAAPSADPSDWRGYTTADATNRKENTDLQAFDASQYASEFLTDYTAGCVADGGYVSENMDWTSASSQYSLLSSADQLAFTNAEYTRSGSGSSTVVTPASGTAQDVAEVAARYDYIIGMHGTATFSDFMSREPESLLNVRVLPTFAEESNNTVLIIVVVSVISITAIGGYFFLRKRREQN